MASRRSQKRKKKQKRSGRDSGPGAGPPSSAGPVPTSGAKAPAEGSPFTDLPPDALEQGQARSAERWRRRAGARDVVVTDTPEHEKLSAAVLELIRPLYDPDVGHETMRAIIETGVAAWNTAIRIRRAREECLKQLSHHVPEELRDAFREKFDDLLRRKQELSPDDLRTIDDYEITEDDEGLQFLASHLMGFQTPKPCS